MREFDVKSLKKLYRPKKGSHKGQNGRLLVIGGSELFHSASMWALEVASRVVDMVFYSSVPVNEAIVKKQKERFHEGIVVPKGELDSYLKEADCVLIGPGMARHSPGKFVKELNDLRVFTLKEWMIEGKTELVVNGLLKKYPNKRWVIDGGALQMMNADLITRTMILTPHLGEFKRVFGKVPMFSDSSHLVRSKRDDTVDLKSLSTVSRMAEKYKCTIALKGKEDVICGKEECVINKTGNEGMTKGGTGDVLAGLVAGLYCKNEAFLAASAGTYLNGLAGDRLYGMVGPYYNASDLVSEIPKVMGEVIN